MATNGDGSGKNAVEKALSVLEAVAAPGAPHRLTDIAGEVNLPKSTIHRILQILGGDGYVIGSSEGTYTVGPRALALAGQVLAHNDIRALADPVLSELQRTTGATVHFALRSGSSAVYVAKFEGDQPYRMASRVGAAIPLHCTSIGKAILAALPEAEAQRILETTPLMQRTRNTRTTIAALRADLDEVRRRGFAIDDEENEQSVRCVGAAVTDSLGVVIGGISVSALVFNFRTDDAIAVGPRVVAAAATVSAALGSSSNGHSVAAANAVGRAPR